MRQEAGKGSPIGRTTRTRRDSPLPVSPPGQIAAGAPTDTGRVGAIPIEGHGRTDHVDHSRDCLGSAYRRRRRHEGSVCREPSQHGHGGQDRDRTPPYQAERRADEPCLRCHRLLPRLRGCVDSEHDLSSLLRFRNRQPLHASEMLLVVRQYLLRARIPEHDPMIGIDEIDVLGDV